MSRITEHCLFNEIEEIRPVYLLVMTHGRIHAYFNNFDTCSKLNILLTYPPKDNRSIILLMHGSVNVDQLKKVSI